MTNNKTSKQEIKAALNRLYKDASLEAHKYGDIAFYGIGYNELPDGSVQFVVFDGNYSKYKATATIVYKNGNFGAWQLR